ncbi:MAG: V-type ATP synthase subunit E family protein [Thermoplasmata archaeon]
MGLESIVKGILEAGTRESQEIVSEGKKEAEEMIKEAKRKGSEEMKNRVEEAELLGEKKRVQDLARAELEVKRIVLEAQREILDRVHEMALERLKTLASNDTILRHLLRTHSTDVSTGRVYSSERDRTTVQAIVGPNYAGTKPILGGIVIESMDGTSTEDLTYETLMQRIWEESVREVAEVLWPR